MNKFLTFLCFVSLILSVPSHAMNTFRPGSVRQNLVQAGQMSSNETLESKFRLAANSGDLYQIETLLKQGVSIDAKCTAGWTALMGAAAYDHESVCKFLIEHKATVNAKNNLGRTPLIEAALDNKFEQTCKLLIENKATVDAKDNYGDTALICAARYGHEPTCKLLIDTMLLSIKQNKASVIALMGIKKLRNIHCLNIIGRDCVQLIARRVSEISKQQLFEQINAIENQSIKQWLLNYAKQQLRVQKMETTHE